MPIVPEGRFIPVNMDQCQDIMGGAVRARYTGFSEYFFIAKVFLNEYIVST